MFSKSLKLIKEVEKLMNLFKKKALSTLALCIIFIFTMLIQPPLTQAASTASGNTQTSYVYNGKTYNISINQDATGVKTIQVNSNNESSTVVYDQKTNTANVHEKDKNGKTILNKKLNLGQSQQLTSTQQLMNASSYQSIASGSESWWGHSYHIYKNTSTKGYWWVLYEDSYTHQSYDESTSNTSDLHGFKDAVDSTRSNEAVAKGMLGASVCSAIAGALAGLETVGIATIIGLLIALGGAIGAVGYIMAAFVNAKDADYHWARLY